MREWGWFVGLVLLGWLLKKFVIQIYLWLKTRIDRAVPDHLPMGSGDWLRTQVPEGVRIVVGSHADAHADSFHPAANVIRLSREVYRKRDASFWAVAAHELGHALVYRSSRVVRGVLGLGRWSVSVGTVLGSAFIFANVLYANPDVNRLAFTLLDVSLAGWVVTLVDEALASVIGARILARDPHVNRRDMIGAITALLAAFMTYVAAFTGQVVLVLQRDFIVGQIENHRHFTPDAPMGAARMTFVIVLATVLVAWSLLNLRKWIRHAQYASYVDIGKGLVFFALNELGRGAIGAILVWLVWDQPYGSMMPFVCVAGLVASRGAIRIAAWLPEKIIRVLALMPALLVGLVLYLVYRLLFAMMDFDAPALPSLEEKKDAPLPPDSERTKAALEALELETWNDPSILRRLIASLNPILHLGFVVGLFIAIVASR